ncbi:hypothetical protein ACL1A9_14340 [Corynebacterium striatum]
MADGSAGGVLYGVGGAGSVAGGFEPDVCCCVVGDGYFFGLGVDGDVVVLGELKRPGFSSYLS